MKYEPVNEEEEEREVRFRVGEMMTEIETDRQTDKRKESEQKKGDD